MAFASETISLAGSGLVFVNTYDASVSAPYRSAIITAENFFQSHFTDAVTVNLTFALQPLGSSFAAQNEFQTVSVSFADFVAALRTHAATADDALSVLGLPATDPTPLGVGMSVPFGEARMLGLMGPGLVA